MHWTLFALDSDPANDYMYTFPDESARARPENLPGVPEMFAPLVKDGIEHAFHLIPDSGPEVKDSDRKKDEVEMLLRDGKTDLLPGICAKPVFTDGTYEQKFLLCSHLTDSAGHVIPARIGAWEAYLSQIKTYLDTAMEKMRIVTDTDPGFFRRGKLRANVTDLGDFRAVITISGTVEPYKYERYDSTEPWIWDDFSFIDGIIREYGDIAVTHGEGSYMTFPVPVRGEDILPAFKRVTAGDTDADVQVSTDGVNWYPAAFADYQTISGIRLNRGRMPFNERHLYFKGNGKHISVKVRGGTR